LNPASHTSDQLMTSIKDVAKMAGVSTATVSRTLSEPDSVSKKTRSKVLEAVKKSGYVANALGRSLRTQRSDTVVVLVPDISNPFFSNIIQGIESEAKSKGYRIVLGDTQMDRERERSYADMVKQRQADGIILLGASIPFDVDPQTKTADPSWPPMVMGCEYLDIDLPTVRIDNVSAAFDATAHLIDLGHKKIAYINGPKDSPLSIDRLRGFHQALEQAGIESRADWIAQGSYSLQSGVDAMQGLLSGDAPSAVFCANDEMAIGALKAAKQMALRVPDDISIVGFDDIRFADYCDPPLTTIHQPRADIGRSVMKVMCQLLSGEVLDQQDVVLPHALVIRQSTSRIEKA
jgi:LacI family transcriptional regulator, repressor for deo operon, udp, cdd, tsx, nupC, and nupG